MSLKAALVPLPSATTGDMQYTLAVIASITGLQEVEPGWVLANGVLLPAGAKYDALRAKVGTDHGANGTLPTYIDGVQPIGRGGTNYPTIGAVDGAINVTLALAQITDHYHYYVNEGTDTPLTNGWANSGSTPPYDDAGYIAGSSFYAAGGGGSHNNMPPFVVVEGILIKL